MSRYDPDHPRFPAHYRQILDRQTEKIQAEKHDLDAIAIAIHAVHVTPEYMEHLKQNYHVLYDEYYTCWNIAKGDQKDGGFLHPAYVEYCDKKQKELFFKLKVLECAHPSLLEYRNRGCRA